METLDNELIIFAMGIKESGEPEILFYVSLKESHISFSEVSGNLLKRITILNY